MWKKLFGKNQEKPIEDVKPEPPETIIEAMHNPENLEEVLKMLRDRENREYREHPLPRPGWRAIAFLDRRKTDRIRRANRIDPIDCLHRKGAIDSIHGRAFVAGNLDYNVSSHVFPNGKRRIRCLSCGMIWWEDDPNWAFALNMVENSTNRETRSEVVSSRQALPIKYVDWDLIPSKKRVTKKKAKKGKKRGKV